MKLKMTHATKIIVFLAFLLSYMTVKSYAQSDKVRFRITDKKRTSQCGDKGYIFLKGEFDAGTYQDSVMVVLFFQMDNGTWIEKHYHRKGSGFVDLHVEDCHFTGNTYAYACKSNANCTFPDTKRVQAMHDGKNQQPRAKLKKLEYYKCDDGTKGYRFGRASVYSPSGQKVSITLFLRKKDGRWRKKHYTYYGTGEIDMNTEGCDLTGQYKFMVQYSSY